MKVLISRLSLASSGRSHLGGAEKSAVNLYSSLNELGHSPILASNISKRALGIKRIWLPSPYGKLGRLQYILAFLIMWPYLLLLVLIKKPSIINPQSREDQIIFSLLKPIHRKPVVWKDAGDYRYYLNEKQELFARLLQGMLIKAMRNADYIYTVTSTDKENMTKFLKDKGFTKGELGKIIVIPSDISFSDYDLDAKSARQTKSLVIGTVVRLHEHKGVQYLLEAARDLNAKHKNLEYWIVGDGPYRPELETLSDGLDKVFFFGHQNNISPYLAGMDIFVQPAEFEGWGRNVKEAMYFSLPVVGSDVGGIAEQIDDGQTGLLFEPKNVNQLEKQLDKLITNKKLRDKLGKAAHKQAIKNGDYKDLVKNQILPLFESALNNK